MIRNLYILAWFLLAIAFFIVALTGALTAGALVIFSLAALGLIYGLALWSVIVNTQGLTTE